MKRSNLPRVSALADEPNRLIGNLKLTFLVVACFSILDLGYSMLLNPVYVFRPSGFMHFDYLTFVLVVFITTFTSRFIFLLFLSLLSVLTIAQFVTFEYFGSHILPLHYIQLWPDFFLIMEEVVAVKGELLLIFGFAFGAITLCYLALKTMLEDREIKPYIGVLLIALLILDFGKTNFMITYNREKMSDSVTNRLFPAVDRLAADNAYRSLKFLMMGILPVKFAGQAPQYPPLPAPTMVSAPDINIVLILGESVRAESLSILGYDKPTTPHFETYEGLYADTIYSAGTMSRTTFASLFNRLRYPEIHEQFMSKSNCLNRLAKENGFQTTFLYSYNQKAADTLLPYMCAEDLGMVGVVNDAPADQQAFDQNIFYHLDQIDFDQPNFLTIMPKGAHSPYSRHSPMSSKIFLNSYDNAVLYTEDVVHRIIEVIRERSSKPTYVIFTGDHGELLENEDDKRGHGWFRGEVVRVPFLFLPINADMPESVSKVRSHFDVATLIAQLLGYDTELEDPANKTIYVNGSDVHALAGVMRITLADHIVTDVTTFNAIGDPPSIAEIDRFGYLDTASTRPDLWNPTLRPGPPTNPSALTE